MAIYPEHEKLHTVKDKSQVIGAFLEWLGEQGVALCRAHTHTEDCENQESRWPKYTCGLHSDEYTPDFTPIESRLAAFFKIDLKKISAEKERMLTELRKGA